MTLFDAPADDYYPAPGMADSVSWGASTTSTDSVFDDDESDAILRSILVCNTDAGSPTVIIRDADGSVVMSWTQGTNYAQDILLGPDGVKVPGGFRVQIVGGADAYLMVVYDRV